MGAPVTCTPLGDLRGVYNGSVISFRAVPFAEPPMGERRFAAAEPVRPWKGLREAQEHGPIAPQLPSRLRVAMGDFARPQSENCLTLTINAPAVDANRRPVLVWLHGGAWVTGAGSLDWYDGARLAREGDIVCVGVNYRLGALGWLHRPGIVDADAGISDMVTALAWVRDNIAAFGGDPNCVTVMGQSAGATSIARLLMLPEARVLFNRAIMQSGGYGRGAYTSAMASERADQFLRLLGIDPQAGDALARLRAVEVPRLLAAQTELAQRNARFAYPGAMFMPVFPAAMNLPEMLSAVAEGADDKPLLIRRCRILRGKLCYAASVVNKRWRVIVPNGLGRALWMCSPIWLQMKRFCGRRWNWRGRSRDGAALPMRMCSIGRRRRRRSARATASSCRSCSARWMRGQMRQC